MEANSDLKISGYDEYVAQHDTFPRAHSRSRVCLKTVFDADLYVQSDTRFLADNDNSLPLFQSLLFATILEDSITEMRILRDCNNELQILTTYVDMDLWLAMKYGIEQPKHIDELDGVDPDDLKRTEYKIYKLNLDRNKVLNLFMNLYSSLILDRNFETLQSEVTSMIAQNMQYDVLLDEEGKNKVTKRDLCKQLRQRRNHIKSVIYDTNAIIEKLKTQVEDAALHSEAQSRYVTKWQGARTEQHNKIIQIKESKPLESIEQFKLKTEQEQKVHGEIEILTNIFIEETLQKIESWMHKYDTDMETMDLKIQIMKNNYQVTLEEREGLEDTIETHKNLMQAWIDFKNDREEKRQYVVKMTNAALVIQAWWRGLLVRNQLGPYKPPKKKGKKK